jgi:hypothetical protein
MGRIPRLSNMKRRNFIKVAVAAPGFENTISRGMGRKITISKQEASNGLQLPQKKDVGEFRAEVLYRPLGSTGQLLPCYRTRGISNRQAIGASIGIGGFELNNHRPSQL